MYPELSGFLIQSCKYRNSQQILLHCSKSWVKELPRAALRAVGWAGHAHVAVQRLLQGGHMGASWHGLSAHGSVSGVQPATQGAEEDAVLLEPGRAGGLEQPSYPLSWPPVSEASNQVAHLTVSGTCPNFPKPVPDTFPHSCFSLIMPQDLVTFECGLLSQSFSLTLESPVQCSYPGFSALCWFWAQDQRNPPVRVLYSLSLPFSA